MTRDGETTRHVSPEDIDRVTRQTPQTHSIEVDRDGVPKPVEAETYLRMTQTDPSACPISGVHSIRG